MKSPSIRHGIQTGIVASVIIVTIYLIGFPVTGQQLVGKILGTTGAPTSPVGLVNFAIFMSLIGFLGGVGASKAAKGTDTWQNAITAGLTTGLISGLAIAITAFFFGVLNVNQVDPRVYLAAVSPEAIKMFLFNQTPAAGSLLIFGLILLATLAGAAAAFGLRHNEGLKRSTREASEKLANLKYQPAVTRFTQNPYARYVIWLVIAVLLIILPRTWGSYWNYVLGTVGIYIILGLGLNIIMGWAGQLVIGYVAFFAIGAYTFALLTAPVPHHLMWNFWVALAVGVVAAGLSGLLIGLPILNLRGDYLAIVTLGLGEIIRILLKSDLMTAYTAGPRGIRSVGGPTLLGMALNSDVDFMYLIIVAVLVVSFLAYRLQNSHTGIGWFAINLDETVARATGINGFAKKLLALALSAAVAGLAGVLFASRNQFTGPDDHTLMVGINVICLVIVGGIGNIPGVFLGAIALKGLPEVLREVENYRMLVFGVLLIIMMRLRPEGFLPARRPELEKVAEKLPPSQTSQPTPGA